MPDRSYSYEADKAGFTSYCPMEPRTFDRGELMARFADDDELAAAIVRIFLTDIPGKILQLTSSVQKEDWKSCVSLAHLIRGAASNVSGKALQHAAQALEQAAREGDSHRARLLLEHSVRAFAELQLELQQEANKLQ